MKGNVKALHLGPHKQRRLRVPEAPQLPRHDSVSSWHRPQCCGHAPGWVHRDIKPANLDVMKVLDFGDAAPVATLQGHLGPQDSRYGTACVALWRHCTPRLLQSWLLAWPGFGVLFFSGFLVGLLTSAGLAWFASLEIFVLYRIGEVRLFTQGYFLRNTWKNTKWPGNFGEVHGNAAETWHYSIYTLFSSSAMLSKTCNIG